MKRTRYVGRTILVVAVTAAVAVSLWLLVDRWEEDRLDALFTGEEVLAPPPPQGFTSMLEYDFKPPASKSPASVNDVSGDAWHDAETGASRIARVTAPSSYREELRPEFLTVTSPSEKAVFPPNLCAPFFEWSDEHNNLWQVTLRIPERSLSWTRLSRERRWRVPETVWHTIVERAGDADVTVTVRGIACTALWGKTRDSVHVSRTVRFRIAKDPCDNAVVYRLVDPPFINRKTPDTFVRDVRRLTPRPFLRARRQYCINCHAFSSKTGRDGKMGIQVRYAGSGTYRQRIYLAVADLDTGQIIKTILPFKLQMTTFMSWSRDASKIAVSANQTLISVEPYVLEAQNTQQSGSDIAIVDLAAGRTTLLKGASDSDRLETFPRWTPDGKAIVFCEAPQRLHPRDTKYSLRVVDYNDGEGGEPETLVDAAATGKSSYYPRFSPDGRWLSFVQSDFGSLIKSSSDLWILDWRRRKEPGVKPVRLGSNADAAADSWYSWSSNSRWIVFTSKRDDGVYARLYLTHIDDEGHTSVPVRLPIADEPLMSFNIPEFVAEVPPLDEKTLFEGVRVEQPAVPMGPVPEVFDE